jgi:uncharacterized membrane protein
VSLSSIARQFTGTNPMSKYLAAYAAVAVVMVALDLLWLGVVARPIYQSGIGHLMAQRPDVTVAVIFYAAYAVGLLVFAVAPNAGSVGLVPTLMAGAMFGFFAYATYDLTNLATLKGWPIGLSLLDMAWGTLVSGVSATAGKAAFDRISG